MKRKLFQGVSNFEKVSTEKKEDNKKSRRKYICQSSKPLEKVKSVLTQELSLKNCYFIMPPAFTSIVIGFWARPHGIYLSSVLSIQLRNKLQIKPRNKRNSPGWCSRKKVSPLHKQSLIRLQSLGT